MGKNKRVSKCLLLTIYYKIMKTILILSLSLFCHFVHAEEQVSAKAKELMALMKVTENVEKSFAQVGKFSDSMIDAQNLTAEEKEKAKELTKSSTDATFKEMLKMDWEGMFAEIYAEVFTDEELQGLIDFYKTPAGQKFIDKQQDLAGATMVRMQQEMSKVMPKIQEAIKKSIQEAKE